MDEMILLLSSNSWLMDFLILHSWFDQILILMLDIFHLVWSATICNFLHNNVVSYFARNLHCCNLQTWQDHANRFFYHQIPWNFMKCINFTKFCLALVVYTQNSLKMSQTTGPQTTKVFYHQISVKCAQFFPARHSSISKDFKMS